MKKTFWAYLQLHIATLLYGLTAILGDLIQLEAIPLVWWRVLLTSLSLFFFIGFGRQLLTIPKKWIIRYCLIGCIIACHWITFYGAIKLSNASVALVAFATTSFFTALIEPLVLKKKHIYWEILLGLAVIPPMVLIAQQIDSALIWGLYVGILSALLASIFAAFNKKYVDKASAFQISFLEMSSAFLFITIFLPWVISQYDFRPLGMDWIYLIILALLCTTLAFVITMRALKQVSAFDANLVINLEPVYGVILAIFILKEHKELPNTFYLGMVLIMIIVFSHPFLKKKINDNKSGN